MTKSLEAETGGSTHPVDRDDDPGAGTRGHHRQVQAGSQILTRDCDAFDITGEADFVLYVTARSLEDYDQFMRKFFSQNARIKSLKTMVAANRLQATLGVHLLRVDGYEG